MSIPLPRVPSSDNERQLAARLVERFTGQTTTGIPLQQTAIEGYEQVFKNGVLLDPSTQYTIVGNQITLGSAPLNTDVVVVHYPYRATP